MDNNLFMIEGVSKAQMPAILGASTISTSVFLPLVGMQSDSANKFFDALAAGRPVAINYGGWQADLLADTGAGIELDAQDADRAAEQLVAVIRDEAWLSRAGKASRLLAKERSTATKLFTQFEAVLTGRAPDALPVAGTPTADRST